MFNNKLIFGFKDLCISVFLVFSLQGIASEPTKMPPFVGDWQGTLMSPKDTTDIVAMIIGLGNNEFRVQMLPEFDKRAELYLDIVCEFANGKLFFKTSEWSGEVSEHDFIGSCNTQKNGQQSFKLKKVTRYSSTLGLSPPNDAIILFDGTNMTEWIHPGKPDRKPVWKLVDQAMESVPGTMTDGKKQKNDLVTKRSFTDFELHLEFKLPYFPEKRGQGRCNSGVFLQNFYEVQILDSYGLDGLWNECGAIYKMEPPKINMCAPPEQWQTYDIIYRMPRFTGSGEKPENAMVTVRHNGKLIHNQTELPLPGVNSESAGTSNARLMEAAPLKLQDHGNVIQFRNIWVKELNQ